jgi:lipoyl(octanoyl) transferase
MSSTAEAGRAALAGGAPDAVGDDAAALPARVLDLGLREFGEVWELQKQLVADRQRDLVPDTLILVEHPDVITLGRGAHETDLLTVGGIPTFAIERGGGVTYHGPGQLVGYPVLHLRAHERDLHRYLRNLEETLLRAVADFGVAGARNPGWTGVWTAAVPPPTQAVDGDATAGARPARKLASIGVAVKRWVTLHGFALNVSTELSRFRAINPCGLEAGVMGSLTSVLERPVPMDAVKARVRHHFAEVFARAWS